MPSKTFNPDLKFTKPEWTGNKLTNKGRYSNLYGDDIKSIKDVWHWMTGPRPLTKLKKGQESPLSFQRIENIGDKSINAIIPIGHAGFIIDLNKIRLVIDPVVTSSRFLKRYTEVPFHIPELNNIDYLLLSHNHRDHLDKKSVIQICKHNPNAIILTGLEIGKILKRWNINNEIQEAGWYQHYNTSKNIDIDFLPSQHWSRRWILDTNSNLWGSFMITDPVSSKSIYFASDSGYEDHFKSIGNAYDIDIAMIGVGAYEPQWFMNSAHTSPKNAIKAFTDLKAKKWIPMHYGTFDLSDEPVFYPEKQLREEHPEALKHIIWMTIGARLTSF